MTCQVQQRRRAQFVAAIVAARHHVEHADVLDPATGPIAAWTIELTLSAAADGLPPAVAKDVGHHGLYVRIVRPQGDHYKSVLLVA